jgi:hypothetical protein
MTLRTHHLLVLAANLGALAIASIAVAAEIDVTPLTSSMRAHAGDIVAIHAALQNQTDEVVFLQSVSTDADSFFVASGAFDDFLASAPDSLLPGESWEGTILTLTIAPGAPLDSVQQIRVNFSGGDHPYDEQDLAEFTITLNDSEAFLGVPGIVTPPVSASWLRASPNPTRGSSSISFDLSTTQEVEVEVYDILGAAVRSLARGRQGPGHQTILWDGRSGSGAPVRPGLYFIRLRTDAGIRHTSVVHIE